MHQPQQKRVLLARPSGYGTEVLQLGTWLFQWGYRMAKYFPDVEVLPFNVSSHRISHMRNWAVHEAKKAKCDYLFTIDPDAWPDPYVRWDKEKGFLNRFRPFWDEAWRYMQQHPKEPCVLAAPACGRPPDEDVQVFGRRPGGGLPKIRREAAAILTGWQRVGAVGTHIMLIDMRVFDRIEHPYFDDQYTALDQVNLKRTPDVRFCKKCYEADIPVLVNLDCWSAHWQSWFVHMPGYDPNNLVPKEETETSYISWGNE